MTDQQSYPTPERVRWLMELRAYIIELGLVPSSIIKIREIQDRFERFEFTFTDGRTMTHPGPEHLSPDQRRSITNAGRDIEQIWNQLHDVPGLRPKDWPPLPPDYRDTMQSEVIFRVIGRLEQW
ncbi:hypothetical protein [Glycomyces sp. NPDC048151]|uniref:hypothetical protein n=1 Tax=Glycomyces sp. NPDC048151 TaxID=3364002 RepID=UPI00371BD8F1